jgi:5-methylcytosine-specific restriction enzyme A
VIDNAMLGCENVVTSYHTSAVEYLIGAYMAVTHGHGNPNWTRDETILALDLYFDCKDRLPSSSDHRVHALSELLRAFPYHSRAARKESFQNSDGVAFKLQNLRQVATGKGLGNVSMTDREIWNELGNNPERTKDLAKLIRSGIDVVEEAKQELDLEEVFSEGRVVTEAHSTRERKPQLRRRLLEHHRRSGVLECGICGCSAPISELGEAIFEAHHIVPLSIAAERRTKLRDMALLCANCHRLIHRAIASEKRWLNIQEARLIIFGEAAPNNALRPTPQRGAGSR